MGGYIGKVKIGNGETMLVGSTLYGITTTSAGNPNKHVTSNESSSTNLVNNNYNNFIVGSTIHIKFINGNDLPSDCKLTVGNTEAKDIIGDFRCPPNTIISFTLDENQNWVVNDNVNTEYVFKSQYNASTNRVITENDLGVAAEKNVISQITTSNSSSDDLATVSAIATYVQSMTGGLSGLSGAMHFRGTTSATITDGGTENPNITNYDFANAVDGDVVISHNKEYVWVDNKWEELGDEGSMAFDNAVLHNTLINGAGAMIYGVTSGSGAIPATLAGNASDTKKFLSMTSSVPAWTTLAKSDVGLDNVTNHAQVTSLQWDSLNQKITYKVSEGNATDVVSFVAGSNVTLTTSASQMAINAIITDENVSQVGITTSGEYPILLKHTTSLSDEINTINYVKTTGKEVTVDPYTGIITAQKFNGALTESAVKTALSTSSSSTSLTFLHQTGNWKTLSIPTIASVDQGVLTITNVALTMS